MSIASGVDNRPQENEYMKILVESINQYKEELEYLKEGNDII